MKSKIIKCILSLIIFIIISVFFSSQLANAAPANRMEQDFRQPSGESFKATLQGDEWLNWAASKDSDAIIIKDTDGFWKYAEVSGDKLKPGKEKFKLEIRNKTILKSKDLLNQIKQKKVKSAKGTAPALNASSSISGNASSSTSTLSNDNKSATINSDSKKMLVLLIEFSDINIKYSEDTWSNKIFNPTGNSVNSYFYEVSAGKFQFSPASEKYGSINNGIIKVKLNYPHPNTGGNIGSANQKIVKDALIAADPYIDYSIFDINGDGVTSNDELIVSTIIAGNEAACGSSSPSVWAHKWSISDTIVLDGQILSGNKGIVSYLRTYMQEGEIQYNNIAAIGTMCHELGHILGLPDLYDYDGSSYGIGIHSLMASGSWGRVSLNDPPGSSPTHLDAWCMVELGFVIPQVVESSGSFKVSSLDSSNYTVLKIPTSNRSQYFLVENRQFKGFDSSLTRSCKSGGIAIWHIDKMQLGNGNNNELRKYVDLEEANQGKLGYSQLDTASGGLYDHYYYVGNNTQFGSTSNPNSKLYEGTNTNILVTIPEASSSSMTVNVSMPSTLTSKWDIEEPVSGTVVKNICSIKGWFLDPEGVNRIEVWVDGIEFPIKNVVYGDPRTDISSIYPQYNNVNCGFHYDLDTSSLSEGIHKLTLYEVSNTNYGFTIPKNIDIEVPSAQHQGAIEAPINGALGRKSVNITGWFLDSAGVSKIEVLIDGVLKGQAAYGESRPDISTQYPGYNNPNCGFNYTLDVSNLPDGKHTLTVKETSKANKVNTLPSIEINIENLARTTISYTLSQDAAVSIIITDSSGKFIKTIENKASKLAGKNSAKWDGRNSSGQIVDSGIYTYAITATKLSGLSAKPLTGKITVDRGVYIISKSASPNPFAPDGIKKLSIKYVLSKSATTAITIFNSSNIPVFSFKGLNAAEGENSQEWDGKDSTDNIVKDGPYRYEISAVDQNGNSARPVSGNFTVSQTPVDAPDIILKGDSPDPFDPSKDKTNTIAFDLSKVGNVTITINNSSSLPVRVISKSNLNAGANSISWDGKNNSGSIVDNGVYSYEIKAYNSTSTQSKAVSGTITVNSAAVADPKLTIDSAVMTPNPYNPLNDTTAKISYNLSKPCSITVKILNSSQSLVNILENNTEKLQGPNSVVWDGKNTSGNTIPDGSYTFYITATDKDGHSASITGGFTVKNLYIAITSVSDAPDPLVANGNNKTAINFTLSQNASIVTVKINDKNKMTVYSTTLNSVPQGTKTVYWNGKNSQGAIVSDGTYTYIINAIDGKGNKSNDATGTIKIDNSPPSITQHHSDPPVISP